MWLRMMDHGNIGGFQTGPRWHPDGRFSFRQWMRILSAWLNVTSSRMSLTDHAAAIQLGLQGVAHEVAMSIPPAAITHGAVINGVPTDPVTYLLYILESRFEALEDERIMQSGTSVLDFTRQPSERVDTLLTRFDLARYETEKVGAGLHHYHLLTTVLLRALEPTGEHLIQLPQPLGGHMPTTQQEYDALVSRLRQTRHTLESSPGNIVNSLNSSHRDTSIEQIAITELDQVYMFGTGYSSTPSYHIHVAVHHVDDTRYVTTGGTGVRGSVNPGPRLFNTDGTGVRGSANPGPRPLNTDAGVPPHYMGRKNLTVPSMPSLD